VNLKESIDLTVALVTLYLLRTCGSLQQMQTRYSKEWRTEIAVTLPPSSIKLVPMLMSRIQVRPRRLKQASLLTLTATKYSGVRAIWSSMNCSSRTRHWKEESYLRLETFLWQCSRVYSLPWSQVETRVKDDAGDCKQTSCFVFQHALYHSRSSLAECTARNCSPRAMLPFLRYSL